MTMNPVAKTLVTQEITRSTAKDSNRSKIKTTNSKGTFTTK